MKDCLPEADLLPFCELDEEWSDLRAREIEALKEYHKPHRQRPCEPQEMEDLVKAGQYASYMHLKGERVRRQGQIRLDKFKSNKNLNEQ